MWDCVNVCTNIHTFCMRLFSARIYLRCNAIECGIRILCVNTLIHSSFSVAVSFPFLDECMCMYTYHRICMRQCEVTTLIYVCVLLALTLDIYVSVCVCLYAHCMEYRFWQESIQRCLHIYWFYSLWAKICIVLNVLTLFFVFLSIVCSNSLLLCLAYRSLQYFVCVFVLHSLNTLEKRNDSNNNNTNKNEFLFMRGLRRSLSRMINVCDDFFFESVCMRVAAILYSQFNWISVTSDDTNTTTTMNFKKK